ncbi:MAG: M23 family metallopeptidase [Anaerolineaceae bacterium]
MNRLVVTILSAIAVLVIVAGYFTIRFLQSPITRTQRVLTWLKAPQEHQNWAISANIRCQNAPFSSPTDGFIGYLWGDSFNAGHKHQGIDIFAGTQPGETPVYAVYAGYLTRLSDWKSSVIIRIPEDPISPGRQIWVYYTHMADQNGHSYISDLYAPGTNEQFVIAGTLLGYQGNFSGDPGNPTGIHLHLSIVLSDNAGHFKNELDIANTIDPSPYFGLPLNGQENKGEIPTCLN